MKNDNKNEYNKTSNNLKTLNEVCNFINECSFIEVR